MTRRRSLSDFIELARKVHGNKYDYSKVKYINNSTKIEIICPKHGSFWQTPANHIFGKQDCPQCADEKRGVDSHMNTEKFIEKAIAKYGNIYDYSEVDYKNNHTNVIIICKKHGRFSKNPREFLIGHGCPKCTDDRIGRVSKMNTKKFIERAKAIFGSYYDYSKVKYVNNSTKVTIICPIHGEFYQTPAQHLRGHGCKKCGDVHGSSMKKLGVEEFVKRARIIHGNKYDYSKVVYKNGRKKIAIICPIHGIFYQSPEVHILQKAGCPKCADEAIGNTLRKTTKQFISEAKEVHGDKYDYSKVDYKGANIKVSIKCPIHGIFWQEPVVHVNLKCGCPQCAIEKNGKAKRKGIKQFVEESRRLHGDKYDYSKAIYVNSLTPVEIVCKKHGSFYQLPSVHLRPGGGDCPKCKGRNKTTEEYIEDAKTTHGNKYDYSKTQYISANEKVCIICPKHGEFYQRAIDHVRGKGCPKCRTSRMENIVMQMLEKNHLDYIYQKRFSWLKNQTYMSLDFYLPQKHIAIECQGLQHFGIVTKSKTIFNDVNKIQERDKMKYKLCKEHDIRIIYFCDMEDDIVPSKYIDIIIDDTDSLLEFIKTYNTK